MSKSSLNAIYVYGRNGKYVCATAGYCAPFNVCVWAFILVCLYVSADYDGICIGRRQRNSRVPVGWNSNPRCLIFYTAYAILWCHICVEPHSHGLVSRMWACKWPHWPTNIRTKLLCLKLTSEINDYVQTKAEEAKNITVLGNIAEGELWLEWLGTLGYSAWRRVCLLNIEFRINLRTWLKRNSKFAGKLNVKHQARQFVHIL